MINVVHVINGLDPGGAEVSLARLLAATDRSVTSARVISLTDVGSVGRRIESDGWRVEGLGDSGWRLAAGIVKIALRLRRERPDVVQTWMYRSDLIGGIAARIAGVGNVVWGVRQSDLQANGSGRRTVALARVAATLSRWVPAAIVFVARSALEVHVAAGYRGRRMVVIPNGIEAPSLDAVARSDGRARFDVPDDAFVVCRVARYHSMKDPRTLIGAFARLRSAEPDALLLCCGTGMDPANEELRSLIRHAGVEESVRLLGHLDDPGAVYAAADVSCSSSLAEGFPNAVAEAMLAALPVVATGVGDTELVMGGIGIVVPPRDPIALGDGLIRVARMPLAERRELGEVGRRRVGEEFSAEAMARRYTALYEELLDVRD